MCLGTSRLPVFASGEWKVSAFACARTAETSDLITLSHIRHLHRDTDSFHAFIIQYITRGSEALLPTQVTSITTVNMGRNRL